MVHTYSLIHDDLPAMDDDDLRRGLPTCHKKFGEALAILAGDALLTLAFEVLADGLPAARRPRLAVWSWPRAPGPSGWSAGRSLDLAAEGRIAARPEPSTRSTDLEDLHPRKTGALFRACLRLGVLRGPGRAARRRRPASCSRPLDDYGRCFGLAFQITDDLLDVEGTADKAGKRVGKDAARGKLTYPGLLGVEESRRRAAELGRQAVGGRAARPGGRPLAALARVRRRADR